MNSAKLNDWMQVVGIFAVVFSLIFVGLQMKQSQEIAIAAQYHERTVLSVDWMMAQHEHGPIRLWANLCGQEFSVDTLEQAAHDCINAISILNVYDNLHFQYQAGFLDQESWQARRKSLKATFTFSQTTRDATKSGISNHRSSFIELCNELIAEIDRESEK